MYTLEQIKSAVKSKGYVWFESAKGYDVNIVGVRNSDTNNRITNRFDDHVTVSFIDNNGDWQFKCYEATTDPGIHWAENLLNPDGVAILKPGQYRGSHKIGLHQGKYEALRQKKPLKVYRDGDQDAEYDLIEENVKEGIYGINIHRATAKEGGKSIRVDKWSAGCQVIAANSDFKEFMEICNQAATIWGNSFTYTLIESKDIVA
jgi:hypothetical protein